MIALWPPLVPDIEDAGISVAPKDLATGLEVRWNLPSSFKAASTIGVGGQDLLSLQETSICDGLTIAVQGTRAALARLAVPWNS